ncbi:OLC1v1030050C1 [Oldenlandia corymbosa var. corymbosa]|uniref:OLC1v1030050C1 n=1 Tax=Oldenlandia corymbosa var. corymbosa TaxID=529605 RepID=A0AAV1CFX2_OLDCO|nr:OLC1v1030050C1 [Oldenlandia corymbosa var. corymbosa]
MGSEREDFELSGPLHLSTVDWSNADHRRSAAASLVQGVYILERDRQEKRQGDTALAPPWWKFFNFQLCTPLIDEADSSTFGAIYEFINPSPGDHSLVSSDLPRFVIAFRGTLTKGDAFSRDFQLDVHLIRNDLHRTSRFEIAIQAVRAIVATYGSSSSNIWLAGHSLGSGLAMLVGKSMAKTGVLLQSYLFNPPYVSAPIEKIKHEKVKHGIRIATSVITAGLAFAMKDKHLKNQSSSEDTFAALSEWVPFLFVNPADHLCSEYIGYFEHRKHMDGIGAGLIEKLATQHSIGGLVMSAISKKEVEEPIHLIPSASVVVNMTPSQDFKEAHGIHQWWRSDLLLESKVYKYC